MKEPGLLEEVIFGVTDAPKCTFLGDPGSFMVSVLISDLPDRFIPPPEGRSQAA